MVPLRYHSGMIFMIALWGHCGMTVGPSQYQLNTVVVPRWYQADATMIPQWGHTMITKNYVINLRLPPDIGESLKRAADMNERSFNALAAIYLRRCLIEDGYYQPTGAATAAPTAAPAVLLPVRGTPRHHTPAASPKPPRLPADAASAARIVARITEEIRAETGRPMSSNKGYMRQIIESGAFPDVVDLSSAKAKGAAAWIEAGARPGLIEVLFPADPNARLAARRQQNRDQMDRKLDAGSDDMRFVVEKGIYGRGAVVFRRILAEHFPGLPIEEAVARGPAAWLEAGVSEDTARRLFGDAAGAEAKRLAVQRGNANKRKVKEAEPA